MAIHGAATTTIKPSDEPIMPTSQPNAPDALLPGFLRCRSESKSSIDRVKSQDSLQILREKGEMVKKRTSMPGSGRETNI